MNANRSSQSTNSREAAFSAPEKNGDHKSTILASQKKKIAFVCSGGATKAGAFHLGVALALQERGFRFEGGLQSPQVASGLVNEPFSKKYSTPVVEAFPRISTYVGSSAGSIISTYLAAGYSLDEIFDSFLGKKPKEGQKALGRLTYSVMFSLRKEKGYFSKFSFLRDSDGALPSFSNLLGGLAKGSFENLFKMKWMKAPGIFSTSGIERYLREDVLLSNNFCDYKSDLFIVATQLNHSRKIVFGKLNRAHRDKTVKYRSSATISDACAASTALPPVYAPWPIKTKKGQTAYYFDGEIRDTLSTHVAADAGADLIFASYTHQPYHFVKEIGSLHEYGLPAILIQALYLMIERRIQSHRVHLQQNNQILDLISEFCKTHQIDEVARRGLLDKLESVMSHRRDIDYVWIHPKESDHQMFFGDHFNLSPTKMGEIVRLGFRAAVDTLKRYEFK